MPNNRTFTIPSLLELPHLAKELLTEFSDAKVWAFEGEMGAGKTTLIQAVLKELGIQNLEGSPTYSIVNVYDSEAGRAVFHFDLYRLNSLEEALDIGIEEMIYGEGLSLIEWPEIAKDLLPKETIWFKLSILEEKQIRTLIVSA
jgi:tRNA threonylcarbamoyladenosine biosynthesis protein TsaE